MKKLQSIYLTSVFFLVLLGGFAGKTLAQGSGPSEVAVGQTSVYTYDDGELKISPTWMMLSGTGTIQSTTINNTTYTCTILWQSAGSATVTFRAKPDFSYPKPVIVWSKSVSVYAALTGGSISGGGTFCNGSSVTLSNSSTATGGNGSYSYTWQWYKNGAWSNASPSGSGTSYTFNPTENLQYRRRVGSGFQLAYSNTIQVNVYNPLNAGSIFGTQSICVGGTASTLTNSGTPSGGHGTATYVWQQSSNGSSWSNVAGNSNSLTYAPGAITSTKWYRRGFKNSCSASFVYTSSVKVTVNPLPTQYSVGGGGDYCYGSVSATVTLSDSQSGVNYQLKRNGTSTGGAKAGTGNALSWTGLTSAGTYTVVATRTSTGCTRTMSSSATVVVNPRPTKQVVGGGGSFCSGGGGVSVTLSDSQSGINYQLKRNGSNYGAAKAGTGNGLTWSGVTSSGTYTVEATNATTSCTATMLGSASVVVNPLPTVQNVGGGGAFCVDNVSATITLSSSQSGVNYQLKRNGVDVTPNGVLPGSGSLLNWTGINTAGTYAVVATNTTTLCTSDMSGSAVVIVNPLPTVDAGANQTVYLSNTVSLSGSPGGGSWSGTGVSGNTFTAQTAGTGSHVLTYSYTNGNGCTNTDTRTITVWSIPYATLSGASQIAIGETTSVTANGSFASVQWQRNSVDIPNATASSYTITEGGNYRFVATTNTGASHISDPVQVDLIYADPDINYVMTWVPQKPMTTGVNQSIHSNEVNRTVDYFDGLGRPVQNVVFEGSPNQDDIVQPIVYDAYGRKAIEYLPYVASEGNGIFKTTAIDPTTYTNSDQYDFYTAASDNIVDDTAPYAEKGFEPSPLNRVSEQYGPGEDWRTNTKRTQFAYAVNVSADAVIHWEVDGTNENRVIKNIANNEYGVHELYKNITTDEADHEVREFTNKSGQTVLKRVEAPSGWADTYYVYDDFGNLRFVLPPEATANYASDYASAPDDFIAKWMFRYKYDAYNRMVEKQVPGAGAVYMVYDNRNRLVLTQDANQRGSNKWLFTKYDALNRPVTTGIYEDITHTNLLAMQTYVNSVAGSTYTWYETVSTGGGNVLGYDNASFPDVSDANTYLTVTYYDDYTVVDTWAGYGYSNASLSITTNDTYTTSASENRYVKGQVTGSLVKNLGDNSWLKTATYYDDKYRVIQTVADNQLGGMERTSSLYDFTGKVLQIKAVHGDGTTAHTTFQTNTYDHAGRLLKVYDQHNAPVNPVLFTDVVGVEIEDNSLVKTGVVSGYNSGAASLNKISENEDGWISMEVKGDNRMLFGLSDENIDENYTTIDYAFFTYPVDKRIVVYENGVSRGIKDYYEDGDILKISRESGVVKFYVNDVLVYTSSIPSISELISDFTIYNTGERIDNINMSVGPVILLSSNSYNELGELIEKDLHSTNETNFAQSIDYDYNIRGWLTSINDPTLSDGESDYFGMELMYNMEDGVGNTGLYNGNISAVKWTSGMEGSQEQAYTYTYDPMNRLTSATSKKKTGTWLSGNTNVTIGAYDLNGNIESLTRYSAGGTMDNLTYNYNGGGNQLQYVSDAGLATEGFKDGNTSGNDYSYDGNGNMTEDKNKDIATIAYNHLNLPRKVIKDNGDSLVYIYDAAGIKLAQIVYDSLGVEQKRTDYVGAYVYENDTLRFIQTPEGRIIPGTTSEYQYYLKDHLGNTRITFTTKDETDTYLATMETEYASYEEGTFSNVADTRKLDQLYNHTPADGTVASPDNSAMLNSTLSKWIGPAKSLRVAPGDTVSLEVYAQFASYSGDGSKVLSNTLLGAIAGAFTPLNASAEVTQQILNQFTLAGAGSLSPAANTDAPAAYLNYLLFDNNFELTQTGFAKISTSAEGAFELLMLNNIAITEAGYLYIYVSNEDASNVNVYFDDLKVTHKKSRIVQMEDYYPFGLTYNSFQRPNTTEQNYQYNGKELQDELDVNWLDYGARMYMADIGRFMAVDPLADLYTQLTPYNYVDNNPMLLIDPNGMEIVNEAEEKRKKAKEKYDAKKKQVENTEAENGTKKKDFANQKEYKKYKNDKKELRQAKREVNVYTREAANTQKLINDFKEASPNMFNELDNLKNEYGQTVDVYITTTGNVEGPNDGATIHGFSKDGKDNIFPSTPEHGVNTIRIEVSNSPSGGRSTLTVVKHEAGHTSYQASNTASYYNYLKENGRLNGSYDGHASNDPSGKRAFKYQNLADIKK